MNLEFQNSLNNDPNKMQQEDILLEFGMYSACDSFISDGSDNTNNKEDTVSIDDLNNVNKSDLLFSNTDSFENILLDNDLISSVSDSVDFYNETIALQDSDSSKEFLFDYSGNLAGSNLDLTSHFYPTEKQNVPINTINLENNFVTENLENIVPNLSVRINSDINCSNGSLQSKFGDLPLQQDNTFFTESNVQNFKVVNDESVNKPIKNPLDGFVSEDNLGLIEFLDFKSTKDVLNNQDLLNNNNDEHASSNGLAQNGVVNVLKDHSQAVPLKNAKIISPQVLNILPDQLNYKIPVKKFKRDNGVATAQLCINKSEIDILRSKQLQLLNNGYSVFLINSDSKLSEPATVSLPGKPVQSSRKNRSCKTTVEGTGSCCIEKNKHLKDKIKKPALLNNEFVYDFSPDLRKPWANTPLQEFHRDNEKIFYYTGIPKYSYFMALLNCLNLPSNNIICPFDMLLLTLMKLRHNLDWIDLAYRCDRNVQTVKDAFGITIFILLECLSTLVKWPLEEFSAANNFIRSGMELYVYGVELKVSGEEKADKRIIICLSNSKDPIHFVSNPMVKDEYEDRVNLLASSGIKSSLTLGDIIIFDEEIDCLSPGEDRTALSVISKIRKSYCTKPCKEYQNSIETLKGIINEMKKFKFICEEISCSWTNELSGEFSLFNDVVTIVCGLVNLCHELPFKSDAVRNIISKRKSLKFTVT